MIYRKERSSIRCWLGVLALFFAGLALWWHGHHYASAASDSGYRLGFVIITLGIGFLTYRTTAPESRIWRSTAKIRRFGSICAAVGVGLTLSYVTGSVMTQLEGLEVPDYPRWQSNAGLLLLMLLFFQAFLVGFLTRDGRGADSSPEGVTSPR